MKKVWALLLASFLTISMSTCTALQPDGTTSNIESSEPNVTLGEPQDGNIETYSYNLDNLNFTIIDESGNEVYTGPVKDESQTRDKIKAGHTVYWFSKNDKNEFNTPTAVIAISLFLKLTRSFQKQLA